MQLWLHRRPELISIDLEPQCVLTLGNIVNYCVIAFHGPGPEHELGKKIESLLASCLMHEIL